MRRSRGFPTLCFLTLLSRAHHSVRQTQHKDISERHFEPFFPQFTKTRYKRSNYEPNSLPVKRVSAIFDRADKW
jgi:hypothetical protein